MARKSKISSFVETLRSISWDSDKDALSRLGLVISEGDFLDEALLSDLHQFESAAAKLLLAIDVLNVNRRFR